MAKQSIATLESDLKTERSKLRSLFTEQDRFERERESVLAKLHRTESVCKNLPFCAEVIGLTQVTGYGRRQSKPSQS